MNARQSNRKPWQDKLHSVIFGTDTAAGRLFDILLIAAIVLSVAVVMLESIQEYRLRWGAQLYALEWFFTIVFTIEYVLRILSASPKKRYVFSSFGLIDLLAILPTYIGIFVVPLGYLRVIRILRVLRIFRILKIGHYTHQIEVLQDALRASRQKILVFLFVVVNLIVVIGAMMYLIENPVNEGFSSIPMSIYWTVVTLTTVGFGDITPITFAGRLLASIVMLTGYAIIAVPTGIVTAHMSHRMAQGPGPCPDCQNQRMDTEAVYCKKCGRRLHHPPGKA